MRSIAFVGVGAISSAYSAAIAQVPQFRLRAVVDNDPAARDRAAAAHAVPGFASVEDLLEADRPDAVVLMTPPSTHEELAVSRSRSGPNPPSGCSARRRTVAAR
jgi:predicted dehydrogenase